MKRDDELLVRALSRSSLFDGVAADLNWFIKEFKRGEDISEVQNGVECVGVILKGSAQVSPSCHGAVSLMSTGGEFGICNIFVREKMPTSLTAKTCCKAAFIPKDTFAGMLSRDSVLMYRYVRLCNEKMIYLADRLALMSISGSQARLAFWLDKNKGGGQVLSKDDLAKQLGMSRASLFRAISGLEAKGIIKTLGGKIVITDPDADVFKSVRSGTAV